jgi:hypothetical protein
MVVSYVGERERIFRRWLENVERLLDQPVDRGAAFAAWRDGYSVREYASELKGAQGAAMIPKCPSCMDTFWVCENHPAMPWEGPNACNCGGAGMPCPACNEPDRGERPRLPAGFTPEIDVDDQAR